ncbi:MAG: NADH-quinone oxidoreductase subunit M [Myxococcota bacterium]|nr:NADH-quinone oxidoreductase subunit M [Myxococcota bacterium]
MTSLLETHLLSAIIFLPLFTALGLLAFRIVATSVFRSAGVPGWVWRAIALTSGAANFVLAAVVLWRGFDPMEIGYQWVERASWIPEFGIHYFVGVDGISLVLVLLTTFIAPIALLASWKEVEHPLRSYSVLLLFLETGVIGALLSLNWIQLYFFWELTLISSFFLMGRFGGSTGLQTATRYLLFGLASSMLLLVASLVVFQLNFDQSGLANFDLVTLGDLPGLALLETEIPLHGTDVWWKTQQVLFAAFVFAFAIKIPLLPFHSWYNAAQKDASTAGSVIVAASVLKLGIYVFLRVALPLFPTAASEAVEWLSGLAVFGLIAAGLLCVAQTDVKRFLGCLSLAHMGFIVLGIFTLQHHAVVGAVIHMLSHGLTIAALFIMFGFLIERRETHVLDEYGGLAKPMPIAAGLFAVVLLAQASVPGTSGFVGSFLVMLGTLPMGLGWFALALVGLVLVAGTLWFVVGRVLLGPLEKPENRGLIDFGWRERIVVLLLIVPMLWIGVYPNPILRRVEPPVSLLLFEVEQARQGDTSALAEANLARADRWP